MAKAVDTPVLGLRNGDFLHRYNYGCLCYPEALDKVSRLPDPDMMLLFSVVLYFRMRSLDRTDLQEEEPMPTGGEPNFSSAVEIVKAVFPDTGISDYSTAQRLLYKRLKETPGITLISWSHHP
jgi:hypothetical protein